MVHIFIDGIRDIETPQALRLSNPKNLEKLTARVLEFEDLKLVS